jgi:glycosyltransferase involved in cell wall biosynthesis
MPLKILHVSYIYPPKLKVADGITNVVYNVTKELARRGHQVTVFTSNLADLHTTTMLPTGHYIVNGVSVFYFRFLWRYKTFMFTPSIINGLRNLDNDNFDIIHIHDARSFQGICTYLWDKIKQVPYVFQPHGSFLSSIPEPYGLKMPKIYLDKLVSSKIVRNALKIIALSSFEANQYKHIGIPEEKIATIPNGIDLSEFANLPPKGTFRRRFGIPGEKKIILYLGRIHKSKGIDLLIKAYAYLVNKMNFKDAVLVIAGPNDEYLNDAKALANSLGFYNSVMFTGFISSEDKLRALVDADVFVTPSFYGFPMTFLEACAVGTPIVTTSLGDTLEWIDRNVGYVTQPTPQDLAEAIYGIISDDELHRRFFKNCIEIVKSEFSIENVVERLEEVYEEVVKGRVA